MEQIEVGGLSVAYRRAGEGPPLLLLHGAFADSRSWRRQLEGLSDEFTVVAWDAPGCGRSADPPERFSARDLIDCLAEFIQALGLERPHVLGLSLGSMHALELYRLRPALPRTLLLASAYAGWAGSLPAEEVQRRTRQVLREVELPPEQFVPGWISTLLTDQAPAGLADETAAIMSDFHPAGSRVMFREWAPLDLSGVLPTIGIPTLLLYGELDRRSPLPVAEALHAQIPGSQLVVLPGVGHLGNVEAADRFNAEVRGFLRSHHT